MRLTRVGLNRSYLFVEDMVAAFSFETLVYLEIGKDQFYTNYRDDDGDKYGRTTSKHISQFKNERDKVFKDFIDLTPTEIQNKFKYSLALSMIESFDSELL